MNPMSKETINTESRMVTIKPTPECGLWRVSVPRFNCGRWSHHKCLILLFVIVQTEQCLFAELPKQKERVAWAGVSYRGRHDDRAQLFPYCSREAVLPKFQEGLSKGLRNTHNSYCDLIIGQQFDYAAGDGLVVSCVLESEDVTIANNGGEYFGQVSISASLVAFDFHQAIVVSSVPMGVIIPIESAKFKNTQPTDPELDALVQTALLGGDGMATSLVNEFCKRFAQTPIKLKGNFRRLQVTPVEFDKQTESVLNITDPKSRIKWRTHFANRIADELSTSFGINILPTTEGDGTFSTMTISFADKSRLSLNVPLDQVLNVKDPTVIANATFSQAGDYIQEKYTTQSQITKTFGSVATIVFKEGGEDKYKIHWDYGVNRIFAPQYAREQSAAQKCLYHRAAIENGCAKAFIKKAEKDPYWLKIAESLRK